MESHRPGRSRRVIAVGAAVSLVLVSVAAGAAGAAVMMKSAKSDAIKGVVGAGLMSNQGRGFKPRAAATRETVALGLHRAAPRIAVQPVINSLSPSTSSVNLADIRLRVDGTRRHHHGVLISVQMQVDHDSAIGAAGCSASFQLTRGSSTTPLDTWFQDYSANEPAGEDNVAFSFFVTQPTKSTATYHLLGSNSCTVTLFTDENMMTAQSFPLDGLGKATKPAPAAKAEVRVRDRR